MNGVVLALGSLAVFVAAYALYSRLLDRRLFHLDPQRITPSHAQQDNIDFCPTRPMVLFGHHFASICGLGHTAGSAVRSAIELGLLDGEAGPR